MSKRALALKQERHDKGERARALHAAAEREGRDLTAEERAEFDAIMERLPVIDAEVARIRQAELLAPIEPVITGVRDRAADDPMRGFRDAADFGLAVRTASRPGGRVDERLTIGAAAPANYHQEAGADEGYMVPPAMSDRIWSLVTDGIYDDGPNLLEMANPEPTASNAVGFLKDQSTPWGATGVQAYWRAEGQLMTASKLATQAELMRLHELYALVGASEELLADAPRLNSRLTVGAAAAIRWKCNEALMFGSGAGQPLGWMSSPALVTVAAEGGQAAATVAVANLSKMYARVINPSGAVWLINQDTLPQLFGLTIGNNGAYFLPQAGVTGAPGGFLYGRPVLISEHCQTIGTLGDIQLVNLNGYYASRRSSGPEFASSIHLWFDYALQAFRWTFRVGGQPYLSAPIAPGKGAATRSHFVTLAARP